MLTNTTAMHSALRNELRSRWTGCASLTQKHQRSLTQCAAGALSWLAMPLWSWWTYLHGGHIGEGGGLCYKWILLPLNGTLQHQITRHDSKVQAPAPNSTSRLVKGLSHNAPPFIIPLPNKKTLLHKSISNTQQGNWPLWSPLNTVCSHASTVCPCCMQIHQETNPEYDHMRDIPPYNV
jgi:hypothetical protein